MAENNIGEGKATVSSGGVHGSQAATPGIERKEKPIGPTQTPDFQSAFDRIALQPTAMGNIASTLTTQSAIEYAKRAGTLMGKNPSGDVLPPITEADKNFVESYNNQAKTTLSLQANSLMYQAQEQLDTSNKLSPGLIQQYQQKMQDGLQSIIKQAPDAVRANLEGEYANRLLTSSHQYNEKMLGQQKEEAKQQTEIYNNTKVKDAFDSAFQSKDGEEDLAKFQLEQYRQDLAVQRMTGQIDAKTEKSQYDAAKLNYYSGLEAKKLAEARDNEKLPENKRNKKKPTVAEHLSSLHDALPKSLTESERVTIGNNVLTYANSIRNLEAQDNQLTLSQLNRSLAEKTLNGSMLAQAEATLPPAEFNNFMTKFWTQKNTQDKQQAEVQKVASGITDITEASRASPSNLNKAFDSLVSATLQKDSSQDLIQAQTSVAKAAAVEIPVFSKQLSTLLTNGDPQQAYIGMRAYSEVKDYAPNNVSSVSKEAQAMATIMGDLHGTAGVPFQDAWAQAREMVYPKDKETMELRDSQFKQIQKRTLATPDQVLKKAGKLLDLGWGDHVPDMPAVAQKTMRLWKDWFMMTGDASMADKLTEASLKNSYDYSKVNGVKQKVFMPVESLAGITTDGSHIVQKDMESNIGYQLEATKRAYDDKTIDWYYQIKPRADNKGPVQVERIHRNSKGTETFNVTISASQHLQKTTDSKTPYSGYYDVAFVNAQGFPQPISVTGFGNYSNFGYRPNIEYIQAEWNNQFHQGLTQRELYEKGIAEFVGRYHPNEKPKLPRLEGEPKLPSSAGSMPQLPNSKGRE